MEILNVELLCGIIIRVIHNVHSSTEEVLKQECGVE